jgi:hypothetical protein
MSRVTGAALTDFLNAHTALFAAQIKFWSKAQQQSASRKATVASATINAATGMSKDQLGDLIFVTMALDWKQLEVHKQQLGFDQIAAYNPKQGIAQSEMEYRSSLRASGPRGSAGVSPGPPPPPPPNPIRRGRVESS